MKVQAVLKCGWCEHTEQVVETVGMTVTLRGPCDCCGGTGKWSVGLVEEIEP